MAMSEAILTR